MVFCIFQDEKYFFCKEKLEIRTGGPSDSNIGQDKKPQNKPKSYEYHSAHCPGELEKPYPGKLQPEYPEENEGKRAEKLPSAHPSEWQRAGWVKFSRV
jgi:hypothetical protein